MFEIVSEERKEERKTSEGKLITKRYKNVEPKSSTSFESKERKKKANKENFKRMPRANPIKKRSKRGRRENECFQP